ncbi:TonB-dependent receptor, plug [Candidatus Sulfopaludibacter sp. SbA4]|nr:TonB-dependent receptor, plug [Candidatus Sulfopaludibacter sp. SbA4]
MNLRILLWLLLLAAVTPRAKGDEPQRPSQGNTGPQALKNLSLEDLSQIEVTTPSKEPTKASQTPAAIFVITGEDIRRSGATSIPEALRLAPGVEVARIDSNKWSIGIRGFGSRLTRSVLVLIDGRTVFTPLFDGTYWEVQDTMMEDIDRIEVIRGPGGTIWGPNAVNGVINIITKEARDTRGTLVSAGGGNEDQGFLNARYGGGNGNDLNYRVYAKAFTRSPEFHPDGRNFDDWRAAQGGFRIDWSKDQRDTVTIQGDAYDESAGESVQAVSYTQPYSQIVDANAALSGANIMGHWRRVLNDHNDIQVQVYYDRTNRHEPNFGEIRNTFDIDFLQRIRLPARHQISWGLGARVGPVRDIEVVSGLTFTPSKRTDSLFTAFVQDEIGLVDHRLSLTLGTKFLHTNFTGHGLEPSARLMWTPSGKQTVWAAFTHALRTPSDSEENFNLSGYVGTAPNGTPYFARFNANTNFAPEQLNGYELGYRQLLTPKLYVDVAGFYNHYHDLFSEDITGPTFLETTPAPTHLLLPAQFRNGLLGFTKGVEIAPEWRATNFWRLRGSYSYLHMDIEPAPHSGDVGTAPGIEGSSPQHQVAVQSAVDLSKSLQLDLGYRYVSALPGQKVPAYSTGDARFGWRIGRQFELSFVGRNLLQPSHAESGGDPGPLVGIKRSAYVRLTWSR